MARPQMNELKQPLPETIRKNRDLVANLGMKGHSRTPFDFANLKAGLKLFAEFAEQCGAINQDEAKQFLTDSSAALCHLMEEQDEHQISQDEVNRFLALLSSALSSGRCHAFDLNGGVKGKPNSTMEEVPAYGWLHTFKGEYEPSKNQLFLQKFQV